MKAKGTLAAWPVFVPILEHLKIYKLLSGFNYCIIFLRTVTLRTLQRTSLQGDQKIENGRLTCLSKQIHKKTSSLYTHFTATS